MIFTTFFLVLEIYDSQINSENYQLFAECSQILLETDRLIDRMPLHSKIPIHPTERERQSDGTVMKLVHMVAY